MAITKMMSIRQAEGNNPSKGVGAAIRYIANPEKTDGGRLVGSVCCRSTWKEAYTDMVTTKKMWKKENDTQALHFVIAFPPSDDVSPELAKVIIEQFVNEYLDNRYEAVYAIHTDQKHMHGHIVFNSVSYVDGIKYHYEWGDWKKEIQPLVNEICESYGLSTIDVNRKELKSYWFAEQQKPLYRGKRLNREEWEMAKRGHKTWADFAAADIDMAIEKCFSYEEVIEYLEELGWEVKWKTKDGSRYLKHFSLRPDAEFYQLRCDESKAWIRPDTRCGYGYSREGIEERLEKNIFHIDEDIELDEADDSNWRRKSPIMKSATFHGHGSYRRPLTDYQRKYFRYLRYTGQLERYLANKIPVEWRTPVAEFERTRKEVEYLLKMDFKSESDVLARMAYLRRARMLYEYTDEKEAAKRVKEELGICQGILDVKTVRKPEIMKQRNELGLW